MERRDLDGLPVADAFAQTVAPASAPEAAPAPALGPPSDERTQVREQPLPSVSGSINTAAATAAAAELDPNTLPEVDTGLYQAEAEVARGGMGRIIAARDRRLGRKVAIKELIQGGAEAALRFRREALITARLQHPGIVPVYEAGHWPTGEPFYAMKLVAGRPLDKVIAEARTLPDRLALLPRILAATEAIAYAHSQRVIHRDLKPGNILIGDFGETVVIDWGLAKDLDAVELDASGQPAGSAIRPPATSAPLTPQIRQRRPSASAPAAPAGAGAVADGAVASGAALAPQSGSVSTLTVVGSVMGTPAYMAPEQARGEPLDTRTDIYALGVVLFESLTGQAPFDSDDDMEILIQHLTIKPPAVGSRRPDCPTGLARMVDQMLAKDPNDRPTIAELRVGLAELKDAMRAFGPVAELDDDETTSVEIELDLDKMLPLDDEYVVVEPDAMISSSFPRWTPEVIELQRESRRGLAPIASAPAP